MYIGKYIPPWGSDNNSCCYLGGNILKREVKEEEL
jgi:hypothetical protein